MKTDAGDRRLPASTHVAGDRVIRARGTTRAVPGRPPGARARTLRFLLWGVASLLSVGAASCGTDDQPRETSATTPDASEGPCWAGRDELACPPQPTGVVAAECPSGRVVGQDWFAGESGVCASATPRRASTGDRTAVESSEGVGECPPGWRTQRWELDPIDNDGAGAVATCVPEPVVGTCPDGEFAAPSGGGCERLGNGCPAGGSPWHPEEEIRRRAPEHGGAVVYVSTDGSDTGAGTRSAPFRTIARAIDGAGREGIVAVGRGTYEERVFLGHSSLPLPIALAVVGACTEETIIAAPALAPGQTSHDGMPAVLIGGNIHALVTDVTVAGAQRGIAMHQVSGSARIESVRISVPAGAAIEGNTNTGTLAVHRVRIDNPTGAGGAAEWLHGVLLIGTTLSMSDVDIHQPTGHAVALGQGSTLIARDLRVRDVLEGERIPANEADRDGRDPEGPVARGIMSEPGSRLEGARVSITGTAEIGLLAWGEDTVVDLERFHVSDVRRGTLSGFAAGVMVTDDAQVSLRSGFVERVAHASLAAIGGARTALVAEDVVLHLVGGDEASAAATGLLVRDIAEPRDDCCTAARIERMAIIDEAGSFGAWVVHGGKVVLKDLLFVAHDEEEVAGAANGVFSAGTDLRVDRFSSIGMFRFGIFLTTAMDGRSGRFDGRDIWVRARGPAVPEQLGVFIGADTRATLERAFVDGVSELGVTVSGEHTRADISDIAVVGTGRERCAQPDCGAHALGIYRDARLDIRDTILARSGSTGIHVAEGGEVLGENLFIAENSIGINVQVDGFSVPERFLAVSFRDNLLDVAQQDLDVPDPQVVLDTLLRDPGIER